MKSKALPAVQPYLERLSSLSNVPRNKKKFLNFSRNSLNIRNDSLLESIWDFLDSCRVQKEGEVDKEFSESAAVPTAVVAPQESKPDDDSEQKRGKKNKKEKRKVEEIIADDNIIEKKDKKRKKDKEEKSLAVQEEEPIVYIEVEKDEDVKKKKKEKKEKKAKKEKKEKAS